MRLHSNAVLGSVMAALHGLFYPGAAARRSETSVERPQADAVELLRLKAALDEVEQGIILLDTELRATFINRAFRAMWNLPDEKADVRPPYIALLHHGRDARAYAVPTSSMDAYVAQRVEMVKRGDSTPYDVRCSDGRVLRVQCAVLPEGGRMLSYVDVSDLYRTAEGLQRLATTDALTGLFNRRHFLDLAEAEWNRFTRYGNPLTLLMLDVDGLKGINETFGHEAGDRALGKVAEICRLGKRGPDLLARVGGEKFALLLPETPLAAARAVAERLRQDIGDTPILHAGEQFNIAVSVGVSEARLDSQGAAGLIRRADEALYAAKRAGRNRVETYPAAVA